MVFPEVSVLLPVRNAAGTVEAALRSLQNQRFQNWEALVVDDGSTDETGVILDRWANVDSRVSVIHQSALGIVAALNRAAERARGPWIARMDADDTCHPDRLELQAEALRADSALGVVSCRVAFGGDRAARPGYAAHVDWLNSLTTPEEHTLNRYVEAPVAHPSVMWRRELWETRGGYRDGPFPEDYDLWLRWLDAGARFRKLSHTLLTWNDPPGRLSRSDSRYDVFAFYQLKCESLAKMLPRDRPLWLWGSGRVTRKRFAPLEMARGPFAGFVDIHPEKIGRELLGRPVVGPAHAPRNAVVLVGVGTRGARERIERRLKEMGREPGRDYWLCA